MTKTAVQLKVKSFEQHIDLLGQYKFPDQIFLGKNLQVAGDERCEALSPIIVDESFAEIQQVNGRCLCSKLYQKIRRTATFEGLTNIDQ